MAGRLEDDLLEVPMKSLLSLLGLAPTERDREIAQLVKNSYKSVRVVGRGTIKIDAKEVRDSPEFQRALQRAQAIVEAQRRR
jgi:hypothetical protein